MQSTVLDRGVLILCAFTTTLDPKLDFFAGTVAGACILNQWRFMRLEELIPGHVCIRLVQEWPP
jgi:hypothetical protein